MATPSLSRLILGLAALRPLAVTYTYRQEWSLSTKIHRPSLPATVHKVLIKKIHNRTPLSPASINHHGLQLDAVAHRVLAALHNIPV